MLGFLNLSHASFIDLFYVSALQCVTEDLWYTYVSDYFIKSYFQNIKDTPLFIYYSVIPFTVCTS